MDFEQRDFRIFTSWEVGGIFMGGGLMGLCLWMPGFADEVYGKFVYPALRYSYDYTLGRVGFATVYVIFPLMLFYLFRPILNQNILLGTRLKKMCLRVLFLVAVFYVFWGCNYFRANVKTKLGLTIPEVRREALLCFYEQICEEAAILRKEALMQRGQTQDDLETTCRNSVKRYLLGYGLKAPGRPRVRLIRPAGILLATSTAGIYFPYSFEAHIDHGLHPWVYPVTMAHELSHGFGVTDEGECNFIGAMACWYSKEAYLRYSAGLQIIRWLYYPLYKAGYDLAFLRMHMADDVKKDLADIRKQHDRFPNLIPTDWRNFIYGTYLKTQGVQSGLDSYGEVVGLLMAEWEGGRWSGY